MHRTAINLHLLRLECLEMGFHLAQSFFVHIIERKDLARISPDRGSFRSYLRTALENYLRMDHRARKAEKRGGKLRVFSFDVEEEARGPKAVNLREA